MYSRVCSLCIVVTLFLGHVFSKAGVEENNNILSVDFDVINAWDRNCDNTGNESKCDVALSGIADSAPVHNLDDGMMYIMTIEIEKQPFRVSYLITGDQARIKGGLRVLGLPENSAL